MKDSLKDAGPQGSIDYVAFESTERFRNLQHRRRRFVVPLVVFFLVWYFGFVIVAAYLPDVMAQPVWGSVNLGLLLGLGQFVTTFAITIWYVAFSNRTLDPLGAELRTELEQAARA
jgi:uncharacterized membrane protein (DUF485 family)